MKWTHNKFMTDKGGNLLSVEEVRSRLANGETVKPNKSYSNNTHMLPETHYLDFMSKNLCMLSCLTSSQYNAYPAYKKSEFKFVTLVTNAYKELNTKKSCNHNRF